MQISEIKKLLYLGDYTRIATLVGYLEPKKGRAYVYKVLSGKRNANKGLGKKIKETAEAIARYNAELFGNQEFLYTK